MPKILFVEAWPDEEREGGQRIIRKFYFAPLWALALLTYLREKIPNIKFKIIDAWFGKFRTADFKEVSEEMRRFKPNFVCLSPKLFNYSNTLKIARLSKNLGAKVILGGCHATHLRREILENRGPGSSDYCIDAVIQYDGEKALYEYIIGKDPSRINNLVYLNKGKVKENPIELLDLDLLPMPDFDLSDYSKERAGFTFNIISQRGCGWQEKGGGCIFCPKIRPKLYFKSPKKVWQEINYLNRKYKPGLIYDTAEDLLNNPDWLEKYYKTSSAFHHSGPKLLLMVRAASLNKKTIKILKKLNNPTVLVGLESGSPQTLKSMRKGASVKQNEEAIKLLRENDIERSFHFVFGAPGESKETMKETADFIRKFSLKNTDRQRIKMHTLTVFPGSSAWQMLKEKTGDKYQGKDLIDWQEADRDWIRNFCDVSLSDFNKLFEEIKSYI